MVEEAILTSGIAPETTYCSIGSQVDLESSRPSGIDPTDKDPLPNSS